MKRLPFILIYSRIAMGLLIGLTALLNLPGAPALIGSLMAAGLISDIMDGILARKLGVATQKLRVWDSNTDQFFWIVVLVSVFSRNLSFIHEHTLAIVLIAGLEAGAYLFSYLRFRRTVATHSWLAKVWTLALFAFLVDLTLHSRSSFWFDITVILGIVSRVEIIVIIALLKEWTTDVPSVWGVKKTNRARN